MTEARALRQGTAAAVSITDVCTIPDSTMSTIEPLAWTRISKLPPSQEITCLPRQPSPKRDSPKPGSRPIRLSLHAEPVMLW